MCDGGADISNVKIRYYGPNYRAIHASRDIKEGSPVLSIPKSHMISQDIFDATKVSKDIIAKLEEKLTLPAYSRLAIFLMMERRNENSFYAANSACMPTSFENHTISFGPEERNLLLGSPVLDDIYGDLDDTKADYDILFEAIPEFRQFDLKEYEETLVIISSRTFGIIVDGEKMTTMVPFMDMLNHNIPANAYWEYNDAENAFYCIAW